MNAHTHTQTIPRGVLWAAALMITLSLGLTVGVRLYRLSRPAEPPPAVVEFIDLRFEDRPGGAIAILDATTGREVSQVAANSSNGFIRGVLRGMFRTRKLESVGNTESFRLARTADGRLSLVDPQTGRRVDLASFGPTNTAAFAQLLQAGKAEAQR